MASVGESAVDCRSGEPERRGDGKVLAPSAPFSKRLSERMSLNMEVSGRLAPGDWGESLKLYTPPDTLWASGKEGDKAVAATEESRDVFTG